MGNLVVFAAAAWLALAGVAADPSPAWSASPSGAVRAAPPVAQAPSREAPPADRETAPGPSSPAEGDEPLPPPEFPAADNEVLPAEGDDALPPPFPTFDNQAVPFADNQAAPAVDNQAVPFADNQAAPPRPGVLPPVRDAAPADRDRKPPVYISMDFTEVDLPVLIKFMSEQTRRNFIFDERVQGKITIVSPRKITLDEAYEVFLSVLQVKGFTTIDMGNAIKIVPLRDIKQESIPLETGEISPARYVTQLIPLQYVDSTEVVPLLAPIISKDGLITSFPASNTLLVIDSGSNIDRILKILAEVDAAGAAATLRIFTMRHAFAPEIAKTLETLYQEGPPAAPGVRGRVGRPGRSRGTQPKFIPDPRTNSIIILAGSEVMGDIEDLIRQLDVPTPEHTGKINVYYLEHADAEDLANVLATLSERRPGAAPAAAPANQQQAATVKGIIAAELEGGVKITADKATNSLIIIASLQDYQTLVDVIKKLDIPRRQVYVESLIMEISLDRGRDIGVEFRGAAESDDGAFLGGSNFDFRGNVNELLTSLAVGNPLVFSGTGLIAGGILGNVTLPNGKEIPAITAVLRAAQNKDNINVLSSPHLLTLDNKEAEIVVGENVPFITSQVRDISTPSLSNVITNVERRDVGITLRLTPQIHESEFVSLDIYQESSDITASTLLNANLVGPTTTKRSARTTVLVRDGQTVVLGGMMQERTNTIRRQIPILGDIPILGNLFKFQSASRRKTNLLLFLTPHIIRAPEDMSRITEEEKRRMHRFIEQHRGEVEQFLKERTGTGTPGNGGGPEADERQ